jgi:hypothetical protein
MLYGEKASLSATIKKLTRLYRVRSVMNCITGMTRCADWNSDNVIPIVKTANKLSLVRHLLLWNKFLFLLLSRYPYFFPVWQRKPEAGTSCFSVMESGFEVAPFPDKLNTVVRRMGYECSMVNTSFMKRRYPVNTGCKILTDTDRIMHLYRQNPENVEITFVI